MGETVRELRTARRWSQTHLANLLGVSQAHLSLVERGLASLTAEVFLRALRTFNVGVDRFDVVVDQEDGLQNALARLGARHLAHTSSPVPSAWTEPTAVVVEVLTNPRSARHVAALVPVLATHPDQVVLPAVVSQLARSGREARAGWLLESLLHALARASVPTRTAQLTAVRRAVLAASVVLESGFLNPPQSMQPVDPFDPDIRSKRTLERVFAAASPEARRWRIATSIQTADFVEALEAARAIPG